MGQGEGKRGRSTYDGSIGRVLGSVAGAHELVAGSRPWDDATQVSADGVETVGFQSLVFLDDQVAKEEEMMDELVSEKVSCNTSTSINKETQKGSTTILPSKYTYQSLSSSQYTSTCTHVASPLSPCASERSPAGLLARYSLAKRSVPRASLAGTPPAPPPAPGGTKKAM